MPLRGVKPRVEIYTHDRFEELLSGLCEAFPRRAQGKTSLAYLSEHLGCLDAKTIVVEPKYIDRYYLEDFTAYYVKCFYPYERECVRLHFFSHVFTQEWLIELVRGGPNADIDIEVLQGSYLGFIVVKPLPDSIIGRTCLKYYQEPNSCFPAVRDYKACLFGIPLNVRNTLGFQEQDKVASACATSALWSAFQATGCLWQHSLPSPIEITRAAASNCSVRSRPIPNADGLTLEQMAHAIQSVGLEPYYVYLDKTDVLLYAVYSYVTCKIPVILIFEIRARQGGKQDLSPVGFHAVVVIGYRFSAPKVAESPELDSASIQFRSMQIDMLYVHDDQVGPYAEMPLVIEDATWYLKTSWGSGNAKYADVRAYPHALLIPLYHKIRIPYSMIYEKIVEFDGWLLSLKEISPILSSGRPVWDIQLTEANTYKEDMRKTALASDRKQDLLFDSFPRFLWRASAIVNGQPVMNILFDATDIPSGQFVLEVYAYENELQDFLDIAMRDEVFRRTPMGQGLGVIYSRLRHGDGAV